VHLQVSVCNHGGPYGLLEQVTQFTGFTPMEKGQPGFFRPVVGCDPIGEPLVNDRPRFSSIYHQKPEIAADLGSALVGIPNQSADSRLAISKYIDA